MIIKKVGMFNGTIDKLKIEFDLDFIASLAILTGYDIIPITTKIGEETIISGFSFPVDIKESIFNVHKDGIENEIIKCYKDIVVKCVNHEFDNKDHHKRIDYDEIYIKEEEIERYEKLIKNVIPELLQKIKTSEKGYIRIKITKYIDNSFTGQNIFTKLKYILFKYGIMATSTYQTENMNIIKLQMKKPGDRLTVILE